LPRYFRILPYIIKAFIEVFDLPILRFYGETWKTPFFQMQDF
jgi:hypothetical protein